MKSLFIVFLLYFNSTGYAQDKVKIHFYAQQHANAVRVPDASEYLSTLLSQLQGMLELYQLVEKNPDLPIFAETLWSTDGTDLAPVPMHEDIKEVLKDIQYEDLAELNEASLLDRLNEHTAKKIYSAGFVRSLDAIRQNSGRSALNFIPTTEKEISDITQYYGIITKQFNEKAGKQTDNRLAIVPLTFIASSVAKKFCSRFPSPLMMSLLVGTVDYLICSNNLSKERVKFGLEPLDRLDSHENKAIWYYIMTHRESFVKNQMESYVLSNPDVKEVYLTFGAAHQFQDLQGSELLEFVNPPEITEDLPQYEEGFKEVLDQLRASYFENVQSKL